MIGKQLSSQQAGAAQRVFSSDPVEPIQVADVRAASER